MTLRVKKVSSRLSCMFGTDGGGCPRIEHIFPTFLFYYFILECQSQVEENGKKIRKLLGTPHGNVYRTR